MRREPKERWQELCRLTTSEEDPKKLLQYVEEINRILEGQRKKVEKQDGFKSTRRI